MNVISWENGDATITDYPECAHRVLARLMQSVNDNVCTHPGSSSLLCAECSVMVLALAHRTVGTADATREQVWAWLAELLDSPEWGVVRFARPDGAAAIRGVAGLCRRAASGDMAPPEVWREAAADAAADAYAADAADAAAGGEARLRHAEQALDAWERITGKTAPEPDMAAACDAYARMTA